MNRYDEAYIFRRASLEDIDAIAAFMEREWKKGGILSDARFLKYEFCVGDEVNFILALQRENGSIQGLWGYYPFSRNQAFLDVAGGPWKVRQDADNLPFLGNEIMNRAKEIIGYRTMIGIGDNPNTSGVYHKNIRKDVVGKLEHAYILNDEQEPKIAVVKKCPMKNNCFKDREIEFRQIREMSEIDAVFWQSLDCDQIPYKDRWYIQKRFFAHPIYKYEFFGGYKNNRMCALVILRMVEANESRAIRIVDYIGDKSCVSGLGHFIIPHMKKLRCEYADFYEYGFDRIQLETAGFCIWTKDDPNIIPNYFEPFAQSNIDICFSAPTSNVTICKADGDQDRPNYMREALC